MTHKEKFCECDLCKTKDAFKIPLELLDELFTSNAAFFAGAEISTESKQVLGHTFYEAIASQMNLRNPPLDFPNLMEKFCSQPNGRFKMLREIKNRFEHIDSFPELKKKASEFHRELGTFYPVSNIVTTNWDTYFEEYCRATPFLNEPDLEFWEVASRRVLKIHGSISNLASIVATTSDHEKCQRRLNSGAIGAALKNILTTLTIVFVGYSLTDSHFISVYEFLKPQMDAHDRRGYFVTPFASQRPQVKEAGLIPIITGGTHFLKQVKNHAIARDLLLDDDIFLAASNLLDQVRAEHFQLHRATALKDHPELMFAASYQDGLIHSLERALEMRGTGDYSRPVQVAQSIETYSAWLKEKLKNGMYEDVAYIEGYLNGLTLLIIDEKERRKLQIPLYYMFGIKEQVRTLREFLDNLKRYPNSHQASRERATKLMRGLADPASVEFHHPPRL